MAAMNRRLIPDLRTPLSFTSNSRIFKPNFYPSSRHLTPSRLRISYREKKAFEQWHREPMISCLTTSVSNIAKEDAFINLNLPRRSLLVSFTCNACGARSQRLMNRLAYERGLVYVQCSGCSRYHKLVDNLGLVVEYNLQEVVESDTSTGHV